MLGILVALIISWIILYISEKKNILALGFLPLKLRLIQFVTGFLIAGILCFLVQYLELWLKKSTWILNEDITRHIILKSFWWDVKSVFTEELIFRGALLFVLIKKIGDQKSILISAVLFGVYHWFSYGAFGNIQVMFFVFVITGFMGYAFAFAAAKTKSIMLPFGIHLGWNFVQNTLFSKGPLGQLVFISEGGNQLIGWVSLCNFFVSSILVPIILIVFVAYFFERENK